MLKKWAEIIKSWFSYPKELKDMELRAKETNRIYQAAMKKAKPAIKRTATRTTTKANNAFWPKDFKAEDVAKALDKQAPKPTKEKQMAVAKKSVAKKVTKEMEYDYKTGKKSFAGSTAKKDAHAEKEGKKVAKALAYDMSKKKK